MASRAPRPCSTPGCPGLTYTARSRCEDCNRRASALRGTTAERGYGSAWQRVRARTLRARPWCAFCGERASTVDHIDGDTSNNRWANLRSLCKPCHDRRTARDQPGGFRLR